MKTDTELKPASRELAAIATLILVCVGITCLAFSLSFFLKARAYTGLKLLGFAFWAFGSCFDPVNALWLWIPWTFSLVVQSPRHHRGLDVMWAIGAILIAIGWMGDGWLDEPPKHQ